METVNITNPGPKVYWGIKIDNLMVGFYRAAVYNTRNRIYTWEPQRTADEIPDHFEIPFSANELISLQLVVQIQVGDPSNNGGNCQAHILIVQDGNLIKDLKYDRTIPAGRGQMAFVGDQIKFQ